MKQKPRWMRSVIEAAKAESYARQFDRSSKGRKAEEEKTRKAEMTKP